MILVTGAAGFIGFHLCRALKSAGHAVVGIDTLTAYYDIGLKEARRAALHDLGIEVLPLDLADLHTVAAVLSRFPGLTHLYHMAAQPGVRYSIEAPYSYVEANITGFLTVLEIVRHAPRPVHLLYASSSSVYGRNTKMPYAVGDRTDQPKSFYGATKKAGEALAYSYAGMYGLAMTGFRFFTVYGPWGRPDMAPFLFADAILSGRAIRVFNHGDLSRDFTYIDDVVAGLVAAKDRLPSEDAVGVPHKLYNLGNNKPERVLDFIKVMERAIGIEAQLEFVGPQPGDVDATWANIEATTADLGYRPTTPITEGLPRFVDWYRAFYGR